MIRETVKSCQKMATFAGHDDPMTNSPTSTRQHQITEAPSGADLDPSDPRLGLAAALAAVSRAIETATNEASDHLTEPTPCSEFTVEDLIEHVIFVARRVVTIGNGGHFADTPDDRVGSGWPVAFAREARAVHAAWADPAKLQAMHDVPWGQAPGAALMLAYTAEFVTHAWDLCRAIGVEVGIDDAALAGAAEAVRFIPADGRDDPAVPFGPVVAAPVDATNLERIVTWVGRSLDWTPPTR